VFLEFQGITLHGEIQISNRKTGDDVANSSAGEVEVDIRRFSGILYQSDCFLLVRCEPGLQCVDVISHAFLVAVPRLERGVIHNISTGGRWGPTKTARPVESNSL